MADSYNKKERQKKKQKRKKDKEEKKRLRKAEGVKPLEFMYLDEDGNLSATPPDPTKKKEVNLEDVLISTPKKEDLEEMDPERKGRVKFYNKEKRFGFIREVSTGEEFFFHEEKILEPIDEGNKVVFETESGPKGPIAVKVRLQKL